MAKLELTYTITQLAREFQVTPRALRFYEDKGLLSPSRAGQNRVFSSRDRARLKLILQGKRLGFPLAEIRELLDLYDIGDGQRAQLTALRVRLQERRAALLQQREDIEAALTAIDRGLEHIAEQLAAPPPAETRNVAKAFEQTARKALEEAT